MAVGVSGWGHTRAPRADRSARVEAHAAVQRAEATFAQCQESLRSALAGASSELESALAAMTEAEDALVGARMLWAEAAGITTAATAGAPERMPRSDPALQRSLKWAKPAGTPRPSFTHGAWI